MKRLNYFILGGRLQTGRISLQSSFPENIKVKNLLHSATERLRLFAGGWRFARTMRSFPLSLWHNLSDIFIVIIIVTATWALIWTIQADLTKNSRVRLSNLRSNDVDKRHTYWCESKQNFQLAASYYGVWNTWWWMESMKKSCSLSWDKLKPKLT